MATLQASGPISVSQINALRGLGNVQTSLASRELGYMGGSPANAATSGVCFPNQVERTSSTNWTYNGATVAWRQTRMSEFYSAYTGLPSVTVSRAARNNNRYQMFFTATASTSEAGAPYQFYATNIGGVGGNPFDTWVVANGSNQYTWTCTNDGRAAAQLRVYVRDVKNCGTMFEFSGVGTYP